jgi:fumarate reductase subunit C
VSADLGTGTGVAYRRKMPVWWWLRKRSYFMFVMRELSSIFIAWLVLYLLLFVRAVARGPAAYDDYLDWAASPVLVVVNVVAFAFVLLHMFTWFQLTPKAMVLALWGHRVPGWLIIGVQYVVLAAVSWFIAWLVLS